MENGKAMITFFQPELSNWRPLLESSDPLAKLADPEWRESLSIARASWILQTFLYLRGSGIVCDITDTIPKTNRIIIFHYDDYIYKYIPDNCFNIVIRADRAPVFADLVIDQNRYLADKFQTNFIPFWSEPHIIPRNPNRPPIVKRLVYYGAPAHLSSSFLSTEFEKNLAAIGVTFHVERNQSKWSDFADADGLLAVRDDPEIWIATKPATKLLNAGRAGVLPLLGVEPAYRSIARPGQDYLEVSNPESVLAALKKVNSDPELFQTLIANAASVAAANDVDSTIARWRTFIDDVAMPAYDVWTRKSKRQLAQYRMYRRLQRARTIAAHRIFWSRAHLEDLFHHRRYRGHNNTIGRILSLAGIRS
jgi:hypothetical protein